MEMFNKWIEALKRPADFFAGEVNNASIGAGAKHLAVAGLVAGIFGAILLYITGAPAAAALGTLFGGFATGLLIVMAIMTIIITPIIAIITWLIVGGIYYIFARLLGGNGKYGPQIYLMALYMAPILIIQGVLGLIVVPVGAIFTIGSILSLIVGIYALYPLTMALKTAHNYSLGKAVASWLIPLLIMVGIAAAFTSVAIWKLGLF